MVFGRHMWYVRRRSKYTLKWTVEDGWICAEKEPRRNTSPKYIFEVLKYAEQKQISDNVFHT